MSLPLNWPSALDSLANPSPTQQTDDPGFELDLVVSRIHDLLELIQARLGTGVVGPAPVAGTVYGGTGAGTSGWRAIQAADLGATAAVKKLGEVAGTGASPIMAIVGIPSTYRRLTAQWVGRSTGAGTVATVGANFEASPTAGAYAHERLYGIGATPGSQENAFASAYVHAGTCPAAGSLAGLAASGTVDLPDYAVGAQYRTVETRSAGITNNAAGALIVDQAAGVFISASPISVVRLVIAAGGNWDSNSRLVLYGWPA